MHSKIIQPAKQGVIAYDNKSSCGALMEYLGHEAKSNKMSPSFFNSTKEGISAAEAKTAIDGNVKGLRKSEVKFYSLVISPSQNELEHLVRENKANQHSSQKQLQLKEEQYKQNLQLFARQAMENYAHNFNLPSGRKLSAADLQWCATIHYHRQYKGMHPKVKDGEAKVGEFKPGPNAHIHIIVSKRDLSQQITLNPQGRKERFEMNRWQRENEKSFDHLFSNQREIKQETDKPLTLTEEQKERFHQRISGKLSIINSMLGKDEQLPQKRVEQIAKMKRYGETFFYNLSRLEVALRKGQPVREPLHLLEHNRDKKTERLEESKLSGQIEKTFKVLAYERIAMDDELSLSHSRPRFRKRSHSLITERKADRRSVTQDI